uniref:Uncharacterized protein n=1 Tax=Arundo donax TaxID=35708 RepID=A0A0A9D1C9_ARUDO
MFRGKMFCTELIINSMKRDLAFRQHIDKLATKRKMAYRTWQSASTLEENKMSITISSRM